MPVSVAKGNYFGSSQGCNSLLIKNYSFFFVLVSK